MDSFNTGQANEFGGCQDMKANWRLGVRRNKQQAKRSCRRTWTRVGLNVVGVDAGQCILTGQTSPANWMQCMKDRKLPQSASA